MLQPANQKRTLTLNQTCMKIITLGTSHGDPTPERYNAATLYLLPGDGGNYLVDAGAPATASMIRLGLDPGSVRAVFITHMHEDHYGGLSGLIKHQIKYDHNCRIFLPEAEAIPVFQAFVGLAHRADSRQRISYAAIPAEEGEFYSDGALSVRNVHTGHMQNAGDPFPSFAFVLEAAGRRIVHTGDLRGDFADFPWQECLPGTVCVCELTHYKLEPWIDKLAALPLRQLIFSHIGSFYDSPAGQALVSRLADQAPFPCMIAADGQEFNL